MIMRSGKRCTRGFFFFCQRLHPSIWNAFSYFIANNHILRLLNLTANIRPFCLPGEKTRHTKAISTHGIILFVSWELVMCLAFDIKKGYCTEKKPNGANGCSQTSLMPWIICSNNNLAYFYDHPATLCNTTPPFKSISVRQRLKLKL